jgi:hypothetical protein
MVSAVYLPRLGDNCRRVSRRVLMDLKRLFPQYPSARDLSLLLACNSAPVDCFPFVD